MKIALILLQIYEMITSKYYQKHIISNKTNSPRDISVQLTLIIP